MTGSAASPRVLFDEAAVADRVGVLAAEVGADHPDAPPVVVGILTGAVPFMMDLLRALPAAWQQDLQFDFYDATSYAGAQTTGSVTLSRCPVVPLAGRHVLVVDGIVDTGHTLRAVLDHVWAQQPAGVRVCALLDKRGRRQVEVPVDYRGFPVEDVFVVGYGMDFDQRYRSLRYIGCLVPGAGAV